MTMSGIVRMRIQTVLSLLSSVIYVVLMFQSRE